MSDDVGQLTIKIEQDETQTIAALKKAGKEGGKQHVAELSQGFRNFAANAAATVGGAKAKGATNILLGGGIGKGGIKGMAARGTAAIKGIGGLGLAAAGIGLFVGALAIATKTLNKRTKADIDRLAAVNPVLARSKAIENVNTIQKNIIEGKLFGQQMAANNRRLLSASNEMFKFKLGLQSVRIGFQTVTSFIAEGAAKILNFFTFDFINAVVRDSTLLFNRLAASLGLEERPGSLADLEKEADDAILDTLGKILNEVKKLRDGGDFAGVNDMMLREIRALKGPLPMISPKGTRYSV